MSEPSGDFKREEILIQQWQTLQKGLENYGKDTMSFINNVLLHDQLEGIALDNGSGNLRAYFKAGKLWRLREALQWMNDVL
jgi:hypothetical protein